MTGRSRALCLTSISLRVSNPPLQLPPAGSFSSVEIACRECHYVSNELHCAASVIIHNLSSWEAELLIVWPVLARFVAGRCETPPARSFLVFPRSCSTSSANTWPNQQSTIVPIRNFRFRSHLLTLSFRLPVTTTTIQHNKSNLAGLTTAESTRTEKFHMTTSPDTMYPFRATWAKDVSRHHDDLTTLASACSNGAAAIETIKRAMMDGPATAKHAGTMSAFAAIEESNAQLRKVLGAMIPSKHFNHLHSSCSSMTADKFFAVVEVTEMVCLLLEYTDLCSMQQVNKHFSALIAGSYKLQKRLNHTAILAPTSYTSTVYFDPDPAMLAKIPFPSLEGGTVYYSENRNGAVSELRSTTLAASQRPRAMFLVSQNLRTSL